MFTKEYIDHYRQNLRLALPVVVGQTGHMMTHIADTVMVGRTGSIPLAAASLAGSIFVINLIIGIGISMGLTPLVGKANGEGDEARIAVYLKNALLLNAIVGVILTILPFFASFIFSHLRQDPRVVELAIPYFNILNLTMLPYMIFLTFKQFFEGMELTKPAMYASIIFNLANIFLNWVLIYGKLGFQPMGLNGAGWATFIAKAGMGLSLLGYAYFSRHGRFIKMAGTIPFSMRKIRDVFRLGLPIAMQYVLEVGAFSAGAIMMGWFGAVQLAAHNIAINVASLTYMMSSGISTGATIRISNFIGRRDFRSMRIAGNTSFVMVIGFMGTCAILMIIFRWLIPSFYINDSSVISSASLLVAVAGFFQLFDGTQVVALGALRGMADVRIPTIIAFGAYWVITIPACYIFAVTLGFGARGVWYGFLAGLTSAAAMLFFRFRIMCGRIIKRYSL